MEIGKDDIIPYRILLIDSEDHIREQARNILTDKGFTVHGEKHGYNAEKVAERFKPELFIIRLELPRLDGTILIRKFRKDEDFVNTPILALSNHVDKGRITQLKELEVKDVALVPLHPQQFLKTVEKYYKVKVIAEITG